MGGVICDIDCDELDERDIDGVVDGGWGGGGCNGTKLFVIICDCCCDCMNVLLLLFS